MVVLPLSSVHYMEVTENHRDRLRRGVADVMEELGDYWTLAPTSLIVAEEFDIALKAQFGRPEVIRTTPKIGRGFGFAFGTPGEFRIAGPPDSMERLRNQVGAETIEEWEQSANELVEKTMLRGDRELFGQPVPGFDPYAARDVADEELARIRRMADNLKVDGDARRRLSDIVAANELAVEVLEQFNKAMTRAGIPPAEVMALDDAKDQMTQMLLAMPSRRVSMAVKRGYFRDLNHRWTVNDLRDIAALSLAVPYCDAVATDRAVSSAIRAAKLDQEFGTAVFGSLSDLIGHL
jgi:hypothetical protein